MFPERPRPYQEAEKFDTSGTEWLIAGSEPGTKARALVEFDSRDYRNAVPLPGLIIGTEFFHEFVSANPEISQKPLTDIVRVHIPDSFWPLVHSLKGTANERPLAVRSSSTDEGDSDGTGIYHTGFIGRNLNPLVEFIRCYESFYGRLALSYRGTPDDIVEGMGIIVQPVVGETYDIAGELFHAPVLSGVCTVEDGQPLVRLSLGMGTRVVSTGPSPVFTGENIDSIVIVGELLESDGKINAIEVDSGRIVSIYPPEAMKQALVANRTKLKTFLTDWLTTRTPYIEFAIDADPATPVHLLQVQTKARASRISAIPEITESERSRAKLLFSGKDIIHYGTKRGRGIYVAKDLDALRFLESANDRGRDFLVVVPDVFLSEALNMFRSPDQEFDLRHFNHAAGVIELQYRRERVGAPGPLNPTIDHTRGKGGTHFANLCKNMDILFLGTAETRSDQIYQQLGKPSEHFGTSLDFFDVPFLMTNVFREGGTVYLLGETNKNKYDSSDLSQWAGECWKMASALDKSGDEFQPIADAFYTLCYALDEASSSPGRIRNNFDFITKLDDIETIESQIADLNLARTRLNYLDSHLTRELMAQYSDYMSPNSQDDYIYIDTFIDELIPRLQARIKELQA